MKSIEIITDAGHVDTIISIAQQYEVMDYWHYKTADDERHAIKMIVSNEGIQSILDAIHKTISSSDISRVVVMDIEAMIPREEAVPGSSRKSSASREELYQAIERDSQLNLNYVLLVVLSAIVATVGMLGNNIAVVIGAMVIAPLLGPNIALTFGTVLADNTLMVKALTTLLVGTLLALVISFSLSWIYPTVEYNQELLSRTHVNYSSVVMALASGAAAALSMTTGLSSVLVGVMVAVAILPPTCVLGLMLGYQQLHLAFGAFLLLSINIVCINLSGIIVFILKGIHPRMSGEKRKALRSAVVYIFLWVLVLMALLVLLVKE